MFDITDALVLISDLAKIKKYLQYNKHTLHITSTMSGDLAYSNGIRNDHSLEQDFRKFQQQLQEIKNLNVASFQTAAAEADVGRTQSLTALSKIAARPVDLPRSEYRVLFKGFEELSRRKEDILRDISELKMRRIFDSFDADRGGTISETEFVKACKNMRLNFSEDDLKLFFAEYDQDQNGDLDFEEFTVLIKFLRYGDSRLQHLIISHVVNVARTQVHTAGNAGVPLLTITNPPKYVFPLPVFNMQHAQMFCAWPAESLQACALPAQDSGQWTGEFIASQDDVDWDEHKRLFDLQMEVPPPPPPPQPSPSHVHLMLQGRGRGRG